MGDKKVILITGSGSGFGKDSAIRLAQRGHTVIATTHKESEAKEMNDLAKKENLPIESIKLDVTNPEDRKLITKYKIDVLINNAGIGESGSLAEIEIDKVRNNFEVNVFGPLELTQLALKQMIERNSGTIIFVSSLLGRIASPFNASYSMTKFSLSGGVEALRNEIHKINKNVHVSLIEPGAYHTGFNQKMVQRQFEWLDENSYFHKIKEQIKNSQLQRFKLIESRSTRSIVNKIIKAAEAKKPKLRYVAPWWQGTLVQIQRIFGH